MNNTNVTYLSHYDIVYINLDRRPDRNTHCIKEMQKCSIFKQKLRRISAIDGSMKPYVDPKIIIRTYDLAENMRWDGSITTSGLCNMSYGEIACCLSHHKAWTAGINPIVIFEDDVVLTNHFSRRLAVVFSELPNDWDIFYLGCINTGGLIKRVSPHLRRVVFVFGAYGYILSASGRRKVRSNIPIDRPLDNFLGKLTENGVLLGYAADPPLVTQVEFGGKNSDIHHSAIE